MLIPTSEQHIYYFYDLAVIFFPIASHTSLALDHPIPDPLDITSHLQIFFAFANRSSFSRSADMISRPCAVCHNSGIPLHGSYGTFTVPGNRIDGYRNCTKLRCSHFPYPCGLFCTLRISTTISRLSSIHMSLFIDKRDYFNLTEKHLHSLCISKTVKTVKCSDINGK